MMSSHCASLDISVYKLPEEQEALLRTRTFREYLGGCLYVNFLQVVHQETEGRLRGKLKCF